MLRVPEFPEPEFPEPELPEVELPELELPVAEPLESAVAGEALGVLLWSPEAAAGTELEAARESVR